MDIRGIEVTNQLRSAIRAKLLELGVRYDEELPDYILVMVVNKKSRQQMHEDLFLFLEDSTTPFVDWLHDQVLKKLQKVTVAKKKSSREFVPTVVVKQEEERKKRKSCTTSFLEDHTTDQVDPKSSNKPKDSEAPRPHKQVPKVPTPAQNSDTVTKATEKKTPENRADDATRIPQEPLAKKPQDTVNPPKDPETHPADSPIKPPEPRREPKIDLPPKNLKRTLDMAGHEASEKKGDAKKTRVSEDKELNDESTKKLKSCVNKPKITSVVSVKNRLGIISPRKKFEVYREKLENEARHRLPVDKRFEKHRFEARNANFQRGRNFEAEERARRNIRPIEVRHHEVEKANDIKHRLGTPKAERPKASEQSRENASLKIKPAEKLVTTIKDRLGTTMNNKPQKVAKPQDTTVEYKPTKALEQDREALANNKNIKNRLGPLKNNFRPVVTIKNNFASRDSPSSEDDDCLNLGEEDKLDEDSGNSGPLKSHIIAVRKAGVAKLDRKRLRTVDKAKSSSEVDEDEVDETKLPSKVIVTPRPLKPLQPVQKRATQSLLLRAVAEANQSVVTQKNPEPSLLEKKPALKRLKQPAPRELGQNLSVHLNASKRLVMEKIQVELHTADSVNTETKPYVSQAVSEEHMGIVMSLFQRSDDNQKFLVTLNGYNNNLKEKTLSDDEERLEMEVNEDDELALLANQSDVYAQNDSETSVFRITDTEDDADTSGKERSDENNENCNTENVEVPEDVPRKKRKLSPIIYNRSHSRSPTEFKSSVAVSSVTKKVEKRSVNNNTLTVVDKSREKCRYWPNCTLGNKCAYMHPAVMCSAFPACKFGDKCAYKHPKCKFGLSCTKLGCVFSHPAQQCKYHPFCTKPACPYSHPASHATLSVEATSQRAKFTWRRRD